MEGGFTLAGSIAEVGALIPTLWGIITANPLMTFGVGATVFGIVVKLFKRSKSAAGSK